MIIRAADFLAPFFSDLDEPVYMRAIKPKGAANCAENKTVMFHVTRREIAEDRKAQSCIRALNQNRGIYFIPNAGGNTDAAITRYNAIFCERDNLPIDEQQALLDSSPLPTSARVETLKSIHAYWLIEGDCSESQWRELQARLIAHFQSDKSIKNPARLMRLPNLNHLSLNDDGSLHYKRVEVVEFEPARRYTVEELFAAFPAAPNRDETGSNQEPTSGKQVFSSREELNAELKRRIMRDATAKQNSEGIYHCRARCHAAKSDAGIMFNPANGAVKCLKGCSHAALLVSFGLPEKPGNSTGSAPTDANDTVKRRCLADVQPESVSWLWQPYIPLGKLTIIEGDPGVGKSWATCALSTGVAAGSGPPGWTFRTPASVLMMSVEDGLSDTIRPRLDSMGADVARIFALDGAFVFNDTGLLHLEAEIIEIKPSLMIIDPLVAYIGAGVDLHKANEVRSVTARLSSLAEKYGCAIVAVRHLTKNGKDRAIYRGIGSIDFTAAARSVLLVGADPDNPTRRAIVQTKNNLAEFGAALGYEIRDGRFYWTGTSDLTASRILAAAGSETDASAQAEAEEFLREILADGPIPSKEGQKEARAAGISEATLRRARRAIGVVARSKGKTGRRGAELWEWSLEKDSVAQEVSYEQVNQDQADDAPQNTVNNKDKGADSVAQDSVAQDDDEQVNQAEEWGEV
ncbi:MAG: AAA family ATPase [Acidobacteriota bacterium]